jgi:GNAT superfamily N-acetyltransferase
VNDLLVKHLQTWLGAWPPPEGRVLVMGADVRERPGWDGAVRPVLGVAMPGLEGAVVSVRPGVVPGRAEFASLDEVGRLLGGQVWEAAFRWYESAPPASVLADLGSWVPPDDPRVPDWLRPFNGDVLVHFDDATGAYVAGVGIKRHDQFGHELSVGTEPSAQGRGLARRLVATAARRVLHEGALPTYLHDFGNVASAKVAEAAGFPDRGWRVLGFGRS